MTSLQEEKRDETLDTLCALLNQELERQEAVLANCRAQTEAARSYDCEGLEATTRHMVALIEEAVSSEKKRHDALREIVDLFDVPSERQTLSMLVQVVPEPWRSRLQDFQDRMQDVLMTTRRTVRRNASMFRGSLRSLDRSLDLVFEPGAHRTGAYDAKGDEAKSSRGDAALIDARG